MRPCAQLATWHAVASAGEQERGTAAAFHHSRRRETSLQRAKMASTLRLRQLDGHLRPAGCAAVGPPGDPGVVRAAHPQGDGQGYGPRASEQPPSFRPDQQAEALEFFREHRFLLIEGALSEEELVFLNDFCERTQEEKPQAWQISPEKGRAGWKSGIYLQPLLDHPELDPFMQHPSTFPIVDAILGHQARFAQFDFRETPTGAGMQKMGYHHDAALPARITRESYDPPDYLCTIHYLCDVLDESSPAFSVVPKTHKKLTIQEAKETMPDYVEMPLYGKAGTACFYDIACCASLAFRASAARGCCPCVQLVCSTLLLLGQLVADRHVCMNVNCALLVAQTIRVSTATGTRCAAQCSTTSRAAAGIQPFDWIPLVNRCCGAEMRCCACFCTAQGGGCEAYPHPSAAADQLGTTTEATRRTSRSEAARVRHTRARARAYTRAYARTRTVSCACLRRTQ